MNKIDYSKLSFSKQGKKKRVRKKAEVPEAVLQYYANNKLDKNNITYFRIPDKFNASFYNDPSIAPHKKKMLKELLAGMADNVCFIPITDKFCLCSFMELKTAIGKTSSRQRQWMQKVPYNIPRTRDEIDAHIKEFLFMADFLKQLLPKEKT